MVITMEIKKGLRAEISAIIDGLSEPYIKDSDFRISQLLLDLDEFSDAETVFVYVSVGREVSTQKIIESAFADGKRVCAPVLREGIGIMDAVEIKPDSILAPNKHGISEPSADGAVISPENIDLIIIPCLSCDSFGNRLGYGGGYYDRYLKSYIDSYKSPPFIALCREETFSMHLPSDPYDVPVDMCITECGIINSKENL
jgi:5-formyltetrahydrofolate cyclo-ligase